MFRRPRTLCALSSLVVPGLILCASAQQPVAPTQNASKPSLDEQLTNVGQLLERGRTGEAERLLRQLIPKPDEEPAQDSGIFSPSGFHAALWAMVRVVKSPVSVLHLFEFFMAASHIGCGYAALYYCLVFFAGRDDCSAAQVRRTQEHSPVRQHWEPRAGRVSPGTGRKNPGPRASFAPFRGWLIGDPDPGLCALG